MGDYAAASLTLYGVTGKETELLGVLESGWGLEWGSAALRASDLVEGIELTDPQCRVGWTFEGCGAALGELDISYHFCQEAKYDFDGTIELFTRELGTFQCMGSQSAAVLVPAEDIETVLQTVQLLDEVRESLGRFTGRTWTAAFTALRARARSVTDSSDT